MELKFKKIKAKHVVKPMKPTKNNNNNGIFALSELDQIGSISHTPLLYLYNKPNVPYNKVVNTIKDSLSRVLVHYYIMAGRIRCLGGGRLELECNDMGVDLIEVECDLSLTNFGDFSSCFKDMECLVPQVDYKEPMSEIPIMLVQVTRFKCGGIGLGTAMSHVVTDGVGAFSFIRDWARLARDDVPYDGGLDPPCLSRQVLSPQDQDTRKLVGPREEVDYFHNLPTLLGKENDIEERKKEMVGTMLVLTKKQVERLKMVANEGRYYEEANNNNDGRKYPYGRFEVVAGHVWRCATKARELDTQQFTALSFCADARSRFHPPLPKRYFGNAIVDVVATSRAGELVSMPLSHVCQRIRQVKDKLTNDYIRSIIESLKEQKCLSKYQDLATLGSTSEGCFYGNPNLGISSWLNLPTLDLDFGWGKEIFMGPGCCEFDGDIMILPNYDESLQVVVGLQVPHMEKFKKFFYEDIDGKVDLRKKVLFEEI